MLPIAGRGRDRIGHAGNQNPSIGGRDDRSGIDRGLSFWISKKEHEEDRQQGQQRGCPLNAQQCQPRCRHERRRDKGPPGLVDFMTCVFYFDQRRRGRRPKTTAASFRCRELAAVAAMSGTRPVSGAPNAAGVSTPRWSADPSGHACAARYPPCGPLTAVSAS